LGVPASVSGTFLPKVVIHGSFSSSDRSRWTKVDRGASPEGAVQEGETAEMTARREAEEEMGALPAYQTRGVTVQDCGGDWKFHIVSPDVGAMFPAYCVHEGDATGWFTRGEMESLPLHPGFRAFLVQP
jgi:8-oxo-dGTP pyrophosphatase MutT (NUDIX family)